MSRTVLVADDSLIIQKVIRLALKDENVEVVAVTTGTEAIEHIERTPPAMVLADTRMPGHDGYEVGEFVKATPARSGIPVVLMTGAFEPVDDARADTVSDAILVKPFEPDRLVMTVRELLRSRAPEVDSPPPEARPPTETPVTTAAAEARSRSTMAATSPPVAGPTAPDAARAGAVPSSVFRSPEPPADLPPAITDELVERLATRVIARLSDRVVRETTAEIVGKVAERVVREELERLKEKLR